MSDDVENGPGSAKTPSAQLAISPGTSRQDERQVGEGEERDD